MQSVHVFDGGTLFFHPLAEKLFQKFFLCHLQETEAEVLGLTEIWLTWVWTSPPAHRHSRFPLGARSSLSSCCRCCSSSYLCHWGLDLLKLVLQFLSSPLLVRKWLFSAVYLSLPELARTTSSYWSARPPRLLQHLLLPPGQLHMKPHHHLAPLAQSSSLRSCSPLVTTNSRDRRICETQMWTITHFITTP